MSHKTLIKLSYSIIFSLITLIFFSCNTEKKERKQETKREIAVLDEAPDAGVPIYDSREAFQTSLGSYKDSAEIKYYLVNKAPMMTKEETRELVHEAIDLWQDAVNKPFREVDTITQSNIFFSFDFMDGKGGILGNAESPPTANITRWNRAIVIDAYDVNKETEFESLSIVAHELGHGLGAKHSEDSRSLMATRYFTGQKMTIDDQLGMRIHNGNKKKFLFDGRTYIPIEKTREKITEDFKMWEFFSHCTNYPYEFHFIDENLVKSIQIIRSYYQQPIQLLSSHRDEACNRAAGGAILSRHKLCQALDWKFVGSKWEAAYNDFVWDVTNEGCLFQTLVNAGIGGFGAYDHSFHIDTRRVGLHDWANLHYAVWGKFAPNAFWVDIEHPNGIN